MTATRAALALARLDSVPRLGWVGAPAPIQCADQLAPELGLGGLWIKRDDQLEALHGGTKVRKLDILLAQPEFARASRWTSVGAIGSGHLTALAAAADTLNRELWAHVFWVPPGPRTLDDLAFLSTHAARLRFHRSRVRLALRHPLTLSGIGGLRAKAVPPGATSPVAMVGVVRAGLELALQIEAGVLPPPDRLVVPVGTGGTFTGLRVGLALAGLAPTMHGVLAVEPVLASRRRLDRMARRLVRWLRRRQLIDPEAGVDLPLCRLDADQVGDGYGRPTDASLAAVAALQEIGAPLEPVYSGKAMAALRADPGRTGSERVLFWLTPRDPTPLPADPQWRERLPAALRRQLDGDTGVSRRRALIAAAGVAAGAVWLRVGHYPTWPGWRGEVLSAREAHVLHACAEAFIPPAPAGAALQHIPEAVDRYLRTMPEWMVSEVHALLFAIEQSPPLDLHLRRLTSLPVAERSATLTRLAELGGLLGEVVRAARDLCMLGYYQHADTWPTLGYRGPMVTAEPRPDAYDPLRAPAGRLPEALVA